MNDKKSYEELLKDPRWVAKSKEIKEWDRGVCQLCGDNTKLHVHHLCYDKTRDPWDYPRRALVTLCDKCHEKIHFHEKDFFHNLNAIILKLGLNGVSKSTILQMLQRMLKDSARHEEGNMFDDLWCAPYTEPFWVFGREHKNNIYEKARLRDEEFLKLARKAYEWNTGRKDFSEDAAFDGEYYDDIMEYKREFDLD